MEMVADNRMREATLVYKRREFKQIMIKEDKINSPKEVFEVSKKILGAEGREVMLVFMMTSANKIQAFSRVSTGTVDQAVVYPREVVRNCILADCSRIILCHNHPSGCPKPSEHDIDLTKKLKQSCDALDIELLDHIVVGEEEYYSFREHGLL